MFATPLHRNLGDHLITVAERYFFDSIACNRVVFEIPEEVYKLHKTRLKMIISGDDLLVINGGGFMGNIWLGEQTVLEDVIRTFPRNKIVIFPQTIFYDESKPDYRERLLSLKKSFEEHENITLFTREENSYNLAKQYFQKIKILLVPDIALSYYGVTNLEKCNVKKNICFCLRNDVENARDERKIDFIRGLAKKYDSKIILSDTLARSRVFEQYREEYVQEKNKRIFTL